MCFIQHYAKLPYLFAHKCGESVPPNVNLTDPVGHVMKVVVSKQANRVFLADGWKQVGEAYGLQHGGWIQMKYTSLGHFYIDKVTNAFGDTVTFPLIVVKREPNDYTNPICIEDDEHDDVVENVHVSPVIGSTIGCKTCSTGA